MPPPPQSRPPQQGTAAAGPGSSGRPRVLMLGPLHPPTGGMAVVLRNLAASRLADACDLAVLDTGRKAAGRRSLASRVVGQWRLWAEVRRGVRQTPPPDIVHIHTCSGFSFWRDCLYAAAHRTGCRVVWHVHGGYFAHFIEKLGAVRRRLLRGALERAAAVIVLGESWVAALRPTAPQARWRAVPNGVSLPEEVDRAAGIACPPRFLFLGALVPAKGVDDIVKATALARQRGFAGKVVLAGDAPDDRQRAALQSAVDAAGCREHVLLPGVLEGADKARALAEAAAFVLPSHGEGLPMALLEAMAHGLPVIATRVGAIPEVVTDGVEGFLIEPGDVNGLADRLVRLGRDGDLRSRMGRAARQRVEQAYSLDIMVERLLRVYEEVLRTPA